MKSIYIASKAKHADKWRELRKDYPIISTWIDEAGVGETNDWSDLWRRCIKEASSADILIIYREEGETLKGALVEVGAALAAGLPVLAVGDFDTQSWLHYPTVGRCRDMEHALRVYGELK